MKGVILMGRARVLSVLTGCGCSSLARGEIWIAPTVLESQGLTNNVAGISQLAMDLGMDHCFLSCGGYQALPCNLEFLRPAIELVQEKDLACGAVIDGPWQGLVSNKGLLPVLQELNRNLEGIRQLVHEQALRTKKELETWAEAGADFLLLADEIANKLHIEVNTKVLFFKIILIPGNFFTKRLTNK